MSDEGHGDHEHHPHGSTSDRTTAPQSEYTGAQIATGFVIAAVGIAITFGIPLVVL